MNSSEFDILLPKQQKELLVNLVDKAKMHNIRSIGFQDISAQGGNYRLDFYVIKDGKVDSFTIEMLENPIPGFEILGFVVREKENRIASIFLTPKLFSWVAYQKKNSIGKFFERHPLKDFMIALSVVLSVSLTILQILGLTLLQVVETFQKLINQ